ncbi:MAG: DUF3427 domain-containing protein [Solobacterium sp.]|nr:DUF3427 domain-containing protein [Solobacterium sp.]
MRNYFLTNYTDLSFIERLKGNLKRCKSFCFSVSFIKKAGLVLIQRELEEALKRGATGRIITSTYQNFTDVPSLNTFLDWTKQYHNFQCHLDYECFGENGFHSKGYLFEYDNEVEILIGSSNITRFALLKNIEWNIALISKDEINTYNSAYKEFNDLWEQTLDLTKELIEIYRIRLDYALEKWDMDYISPNVMTINPNSMQRKALKEIRRYRDMGVNKALVVSATGSGKTYLAAFDARNYGARRLLYVVHRDVILRDARNTFMNVFGSERTYGLYTGQSKDLDCDFVFASTAMLSRHLSEFSPNEFDYIVYDEVHHIVAESGQRIFQYFHPEFMLGLTATPERMDNKDIFGLFDQNIPFELRLRDAILNDLVVPFHYYGIRTKLANYKDQDRMKIAKEIAKQDNVDFITKQIEIHRPINEKLKCLAFCTNIQHCKLMAEEFNEMGYCAVSLTGVNDLGQRIRAFKDLQDDQNPLQIICAVDILNEGIDIPQVNMVLFLRPTESQTIFIQQLGRGLRKYPGKEYVTVLDFIGNNYDRSVQIALALGSLGRTTYTEKAYLKALIRSDFASIGIPGVTINIDDLSKEEIIYFIDNMNFNRRDFLKKDYENFKSYIQCETYPSHMDYLDYDISPDLIRFMKANMGGKNKSYYSFLMKIGEKSIPYFNKAEIKLLDQLEDMLPLVRPEEYLVLEQFINKGTVNIHELQKEHPESDRRILEYAHRYLIKNNILENPSVDMNNSSPELIEYLKDTVEYGLTRYDAEFGDFEGKYKLYSNYYKEQIAMIMLKDGAMDLRIIGTYYDPNNIGDTYVFIGLKKDEVGKLNYKDKFISPSVFQWESKNNTTVDNAEGKKLINTKRVFLFVRKIEREDGVVLPFTYFGTGKFQNMRVSFTEENGKEYPTLLFDIALDKEVPSMYYLDFEIPEGHIEV